MGTKNILTVNAGSSSIKLDVFVTDTTDTTPFRVLNASITGITLSTGTFTTHDTSGEKQTRHIPNLEPEAAIGTILAWLQETLPAQSVAAIGHRIVHGGPSYMAPQIIDNHLQKDLEGLAHFDPEHAPAALQLIRVLRKQFPGAAHVACFDTAFFNALPRLARILPLPRTLESIGLKRYGFHGLSYAYIQSKFREIAGEVAVNGRVIMAHLGSGASLAATAGGQAVDTTMGFTPASGIIMSSRSGDLDPGIISFLHAKTGMTIEEYNRMVHLESGLLGVSELSADMYTLLQHESTDQRAAEAVQLFVYQVKKSIGALSAVLGGLDSLIFSGGIGEQSAILRERICAGLDYLGIQLDAESNAQHAELISSPHSQVGVHVIATDEAQVIATHTVECMAPQQKQGETLHAI